MSRRTLADAKASRIPSALNLLETEARFTDYVNAATERLMNRGRWLGLTPKYTVNITDQLFTLPPQFATLEKAAVAQWPVTLRNQWYEFSGNGYGVLNDPTADVTDSGTSQAVLRGLYPTFKDLTTGRKARVQCDVADDIAVKVLLLGYDSNGNWVRTKPVATWIDGEQVALAQSPGTLSTTTWSKITDIQKPVTKGQIWLYDWDGAANTLIGNYQYWEESPAYQRYLLPIIPGTSTQIDVIGKLAFRKVTNDSDYLLISNLEALRLACMAVKLEEEHMVAEAALLMNGGMSRQGVRIDGAVTILQQELEHFQGGAIPTFDIVGANLDDQPVEMVL